jgi:polysaccharide chain length determinant protein (PEP-CTERM system associated)
MQQQILSRTRLEPLIHQFGLYPSDIGRVSMDTLIDRLGDAIDVTPVVPMAETGSGSLPGFYVKVTMDNPRNAQAVSAAVTSMFIEENIRLRQQHSETTTQFMSQQLTEAKTKLDAQDAKLAAFESRYLGALPDEEATNLNLLTGMTSQLDAATQALYRAQQDKSYAESMLAQQLANWKAAQSGHDPEAIDQQLVTLQNQLASLQSRYTDNYPDVVKARKDLENFQKQMAENNARKPPTDTEKPAKASIEPEQITQLRAEIHSHDQVIAEKTKEQEKIKQQIALYQSRVQSSPDIEQQYKALTRGYQAALESYNDLQKKRDDSQMASELERKQESERFRVLDPANLPDKPSSPKRPLFALGGLGGGLALGVGLALFQELYRTTTRMRNEKDVEFALRLPVLAILPDIQPLTERTSKPSQTQILTGGKLTESVRA